MQEGTAQAKAAEAHEAAGQPHAAVAPRGHAVRSRRLYLRTARGRSQPLLEVVVRDDRAAQPAERAEATRPRRPRSAAAASSSRRRAAARVRSSADAAPRGTRPGRASSTRHASSARTAARRARCRLKTSSVARSPHSASQARARRSSAPRRARRARARPSRGRRTATRPRPRTRVHTPHASSTPRARGAKSSTRCPWSAALRWTPRQPPPLSPRSVAERGAARWRPAARRRKRPLEGGELEHVFQGMAPRRFARAGELRLAGVDVRWFARYTNEWVPGPGRRVDPFVP